MAQVRDTQIFNSSEHFVEGWYWALRSRQLKRGRVLPAHVMGRELALYRGLDGRVRALDAYCPHMGAHLAEGRVQDNSLRCFFHDWQFNEQGQCIDAPSLAQPPKACVKTWPCAEKYGLIWVWTGAQASLPVPYVPELKDLDCDASLGNQFVKECHSNVVMVNAIDAHHFNTVHNLPVDLKFETAKLNDRAMTFENTTKLPNSSAFTRFLGRFYKGPLTYKMCYWFGSTGSVTIGPDFLHFHIIFALRLNKQGQAEGQTILVTRKRTGLFGWLFNRALLTLTKTVGNYFAKGDTQIFRTIRWDFKTPTKADQAIIEFIQDIERQPALKLGDWSPAQFMKPPMEPPVESMAEPKQAPAMPTQTPTAQASLAKS